MLKDLILKNRSYRRYYQYEPVSEVTLRDLVDCARLVASGRNAQPLKYYLACDPETNATIFAHLAWAGYLPDWGGPVEGEKPAAYILVLGDKTISDNFGIDPGIAAQTILLAATEQGLGGCILGSVKKPQLAWALHLPGHLEILYCVALGKPKETVVIEPVGAEGDIKYWREPDGTHHVPKRGLDEVIVKHD
jgi:nitroreductase